MINTRILGLAPDAKKHIAATVFFQWVTLLANIGLILLFTKILGLLQENRITKEYLIITAAIFAAIIFIRFAGTRLTEIFAFAAGESVKINLRRKTYEKLLRMGTSWSGKTSAGETVQLTAEGVEQLEIYFGQYLPQLFYSFSAAVTLFVVILFLNSIAAVVLLGSVGLTFIFILIGQKMAGKAAAGHLKQHTRLSNVFLENLQGLTTLKIYQADAGKQRQMEEESENFRKSTMNVLAMQLNSISVMDVIAYGGAAVAVIFPIFAMISGKLDFAAAFAIILLSAEFYLPMRQLGSFFHVSMNGVKAAERLMFLLDEEEPVKGNQILEGGALGITLQNVRFSYDKNRIVLNNISLQADSGSFVSIVGHSGCGKSTIAALLMSIHRGYEGSIQVGGKELSDISEKSLMKHLTLVNSNSYIFGGTVYDNLLAGKPDATDAELYAVLEQVNLAGFLKMEDGLKTEIAERGANLSGGQRQRLAIARALLNDTAVYIFDEATSNIDAESESDIMAAIHTLAKTKTVILISHRLSNVIHSDMIFVLNKGEVAETGTHASLLENGTIYAELYRKQMELENYSKELGECRYASAQ